MAPIPGLRITPLVTIQIWSSGFGKVIVRAADKVACVAGPQFYGGPDLQRAGFWRARGRIEGLQESLPFMTTRRSDSER